MSKSLERAGVTATRERRRRYTTEEKVRFVKETAQPGMTVSTVARLHNIPLSLLFGWRRRLSIGGRPETVHADEDMVPVSRIRELEAKVQELERLLGRKTIEVEILREAMGHTRDGELALRLPPPEDDPH